MRVLNMRFDARNMLLSSNDNRIFVLATFHRTYSGMLAIGLPGKSHWP